MNYKNVIIALSVLFALTLSACSTVEGIGKDVESLGEGIQEASN